MKQFLFVGFDRVIRDPASSHCCLQQDHDEGAHLLARKHKVERFRKDLPASICENIGRREASEVENINQYTHETAIPVVW